MGKKAETNPADTYVLDDDVMDEMENLEATVVLDDTQKGPTDTDVLHDGFLDDIEENTVVLSENRQSPPLRKRADPNG